MDLKINYAIACYASLTYFFETKEKTKKKKADSLGAMVRCQGFLKKYYPGW